MFPRTNTNTNVLRPKAKSRTAITVTCRAAWSTPRRPARSTAADSGLPRRSTNNRRRSRKAQQVPDGRKQAEHYAAARTRRAYPARRDISSPTTKALRPSIERQRPRASSAAETGSTTSRGGQGLASQTCNNTVSQLSNLLNRSQSPEYRMEEHATKEGK